MEINANQESYFNNSGSSKTIRTLAENEIPGVPAGKYVVSVILGKELSKDEKYTDLDLTLKISLRNANANEIPSFSENFYDALQTEFPGVKNILETVLQNEEKDREESLKKIVEIPQCKTELEIFEDFLASEEPENTSRLFVPLANSSQYEKLGILCQYNSPSEECSKTLVEIVKAKPYQEFLKFLSETWESLDENVRESILAVLAEHKDLENFKKYLEFFMPFRPNETFDAFLQFLYRKKLAENSEDFINFFHEKTYWSPYLGKMVSFQN